MLRSANYHRVLQGCMALAVAVGAYARLKGLGVWPLAVDEYFIAESVGNILKHGLPEFGCGGYYMRGLTLQYLIAPLYALGLSAELGGRLVTVACSFAVLPGVYLLGKRLSGTTVACLGVILLSLSLWEIEFARFARMYMPFQAVFVWYVLTMHRVVVDRDESAYKWLWLLSVVGVFTWEGGLFLLVTNFVPSLIASTPARAKHWAVNAALLVVGYEYNALDFRFMGPQPFPTDVPVHAGGSHFVRPPVLASTLLNHPIWLVGALALMFLCIAAVVTLARAPAAPRERIAWVAVVALSSLNLFGCVLIGLLLASLLGWIDVRRPSRRCALIAGVAGAASFVFWLGYASLTGGPQQLFPTFGPGGELSKLVVVLFKYPNVFDPILFKYFSTIPVWTLLVGGLAGLATLWAVWARNGRRSAALRLTLVVFIVMSSLVGVIDTKYIQTRYTFFLLPLFYLLALTAIHTLFVRPVASRPRQGMALGLSLVALVGLTEDFGWAHMAHIDRMAWNYRLPFNDALVKHYYQRRDYRTPAEFINRRARPSSLIIVAAQVVPFYLKRTDYMYWNFTWGEFNSFACDSGRRERWSGNRLIYRRQDLTHIIESAPGNVWVVAMIGLGLSPIDYLKKKYKVTLAYRSSAGVLGVYKIAKTKLTIIQTTNDVSVSH